MRGLDTRILLATARIMWLVDVAKATDLLTEVGNLAEADGVTDAVNGVHTMPAMFDDELLLASRWCAGQQHHAEGSDKGKWQKICADLAKEANRNCGLSYELFVHCFSRAIDTALVPLSPDERASAIAIAVDFGYASREEHAARLTQEMESSLRWCAHGLQMGCCPAGCDYPDSYFDGDDVHASI